MRSSMLLAIGLCLAFLSNSQSMTIYSLAADHPVLGDTLYLETYGQPIQVQVGYRITGTSLPVPVDITRGNSTMVGNPSLLGLILSPLTTTLDASNGFQSSFTVDLVGDYGKADISTVIFSWPDFANPAILKSKTLTILIHQRNKVVDWQPDPSNIPRQELVQYTDFLGINSDRPNGAFQQQLIVKWPLIKNYFKFNDNIKIQFLRSVLIPNIILNRIDKARDDSSLLVPLGRSISANQNDTVPNVVGTFDLIRYANTLFSSSINIFTIHIANTRIYLDYDFGILRNRIYDTLSQSNAISRPIYSSLSGIHLYAKSVLDPKKHFNIEVDFGYRNVHLMDNFFQQYDIYTFENGNTKAIRFALKKDGDKANAKPIGFGSMKLSKEWGVESSNSGFFRVKYQWQHGKYNLISKDDPGVLQKDQVFYNHFFQVNLGLSLGIDRFFR